MKLLLKNLKQEKFTVDVEPSETVMKPLVALVGIIGG